MTREEAKELIAKFVVEKQGCKATELAAEKDIALLPFPVPELIEEAVNEKKIIEVEYEITQLDRIKSYLLPIDADPKIAMCNDIKKEIKELLESANIRLMRNAYPFQEKTPHIYFDCESGVFGADHTPSGQNSLCYTTSKERSNYIIKWLNCLAEIFDLANKGENNDN